MGLRRGIYAFGALAAGAGLVAESPAIAQSVAPTREELTRPELAPPQPRSTLNVIGGVERSPCPLANPEFNDVRVTITNVDFNNLKGATPEEMRATWAEFAGTEHPVSVICEIRDRAGTYLRNKGYLAAVQVPTQRIENGQVRLELLYARVTTVRARGETGGAEAKLAGYLAKLTEDEVFDRNRAERYLLLARDLPGYNVQLVLKPAGTGPGELVGEVSVIRRPYSVDFMVSNLAAEETGRWGGQLRAQAPRPDGARRQHLRLHLLDQRLQGAADFPGGSQLPAGIRGPVGECPVHLFLERAVNPAQRGRPRARVADPVRHAGRRLSADPHAGEEPVDQRGLRLRQPEVRFLRAPEPRPAAHPVGARRFRRHRPALAPAEVACRRDGGAAPRHRRVRRQQVLHLGRI